MAISWRLFGGFNCYLSNVWSLFGIGMNLKTSLSFRIDSLLVGITFPVTKRKRLAGQYQCRNQDSGIVNADSGVNAKSFTINQNQCSRSTRMGVHDGAESAFTLGQNTHLSPPCGLYELDPVGPPFLITFCPFKSEMRHAGHPPVQRLPLPCGCGHGQTERSQKTTDQLMHQGPARQRHHPMAPVLATRTTH